jgi:peptide/nickel transport system permease protein
MSVPQFWLGMILIIVFASSLQLFPLSGMHTPGVHTISDALRHMVLPCLTLCITNMAPYVRYVRSSTIHELEEEYVLTAKAKGCSPSAILSRHVLKNSLLPVITLVGMNLSSIVGGSFVLEKVFGWPGIGMYAISAIQSRDYPVIMAYTMIVGTVLVFGNLLADVLYAVADPRIRQGMDVNYE